MDSVNVKIFETPEEAPNYNELGGYIGAVLEEAVVVRNGTKRGNPTVDLVFKDSNGLQYVALVKGSYLTFLSEILKGGADG